MEGVETGMEIQIETLLILLYVMEEGESSIGSRNECSWWIRSTLSWYSDCSKDPKKGNGVRITSE